MFLKGSVIIAAIFTILIAGDNKVYQKNYYDNQKLESEGWVDGTNKIGYWKYYYKNGQLSEQGHYIKNFKEKYWHIYHANGNLQREGHFLKDDMVDWWLIYDLAGKIEHKCQLIKGIKNGYCLKYEDEKLISAEKYSKGKKIKEWFSLWSFKRDNNL